MARRGKTKFRAGLTILLTIAFLFVGTVAGAVGYLSYSIWISDSDEIPTQNLTVDGNLQIHFLELGNKYTGDCIYIKAGDTDILIDAGSRTSSVTAISTYINQYVTDGILEYVIVTHAHEDHYAGFSLRDGSIFDLYQCETIIDFAMTNQEEKKANGNLTMYGNYQAELADEIAAGAKHYTAADCLKGENGAAATYTIGEGMELQILDSYYYYNLSSTENNHSVCTMINYGENHYLFTGDLESDGESRLVDMNELPHVTLYKAGHHGSKTSSGEKLLSAITPEIVCVCCCAGSPEYTKNDENQFPTQQFVDRIAPYTDKVYVTTLCTDYSAGTYTSMNGNIIVSADANAYTVICSNVDTILKEWAWFREHRTCPAAWQ